MIRNEVVSGYRIIVSILGYCLFLFHGATFAKPAELIFCYEDKSVAPLFVGIGHEVPIVEPGASIEILRSLDRHLPEVTISYQRKPWRQCLNDLRNNKVNAVIATYRANRAEFAQYPLDQSDHPDPRYAINEFGSCLIGRDKFRQQWQSREIFQSKAFTLAVPNGFGLGDSLAQEPFFIHTTFSKEKAFELISKGEVDATVDLCQIDGHKVSNYPNESDGVRAVYPPYETSHGYLLLSKMFFKHHQSLSQKIWQQLAVQDNAKLYIQYLNKVKYQAQLAKNGQG